MNVLKHTKEQIIERPEILEKMENFRNMVNGCITLGLDDNVCGLKKLIPLCFEYLKDSNESDDVKYYVILQAWKQLMVMKLSIKEGERLESPFIQNPYFMSKKDMLKIRKIRECTINNFSGVK